MSKVYAYERDPYRRQLQVEILEVGSAGGRPFALLNDTILYPEGGGQPSDRGRLAGVEVTDVQRGEGEVRHCLAAEVKAGSAALELDWERRYDHMQQHTAQHLLSALAVDRFGWATTSFHLGAEVSDIELDTQPPSEEELQILEEAVMAQVRAARPVYARRVSRQEYTSLDVRSRGLPEGHRGDVRLVEIEGIDLSTCGGTHLTSTSEIESVKLLGAEAMRGGCRLTWVAGRRVRRRLAEHEVRNVRLRALLETGDADLVQVAEVKLGQLDVARRRQRDLEGTLADAVVENLLAREASVVESHFEATDAGFLQSVARRLAGQAVPKVAFLTAGGDKGAFFALVVGKESDVDLQAVGPLVAQLLEGRGGGSGRIFQGKAGSLSQRDRALELVRREAGEGSL